MNSFSRRKFMISSTAAAAALGSSTALGEPYTYPFGRIQTASETHETDLSLFNSPQPPKSKQVTVYAHVSPELNGEAISVEWAFSTDDNFETIIQKDSTVFYGEQDNLISITLMDVPPGTSLFYQLTCENCYLNKQSTVMAPQTQKALSNNELLFRPFVVYPTTPISTDLLSWRRQHTKLHDLTNYS